MRHVLFVQPSLDAVGGIEKVIPTVAEGIASSGWSVSTCVFYGSVPETQTFWRVQSTEDEQSTRNFFDKVKKVIQRARRITEIVRSFNVSCIVVSAQGAICIVLLLKIVKVIRVPVVAYIHEGRNDGGWWYRILTALLYPFADGWMCVSDGIRQEIAELPFVRIERVVRVYNAVPPYTPSGGVPQVDGRSIDAMQRPLLISAGRLEYTKGADVLVRAFMQYASEHPGTLLVLGTGSLLPELQALVLRHGMCDRVFFLGRTGNVQDYIVRCDAYVSCARSEPFGLALVEALAVGVSVCATDVPSGPREILSPGKVPDQYPFRAAYGVLIPPPAGKEEADGVAFTKGLAMLFSNSYKSTELQSRAQMFTPAMQQASVYRLLKVVTE